MHDVAIVGFGPSGAVAAGLLGQMGLSVFVCDRQRDVYDKPRAISLDHEVMRTFQQLGVVHDIEPHVEPFTPSEYFGVDGQLIRRMTMLAPPHPQGYTPSMVFNQPAVERVLRARAAALPRVDIALGVELVSLAQDDTGVTLRLRDAQGDLHTQRARFVIGCDGAASTVRSLLAIELDDLDFDERWLVVDVRVNPRGLAKLPKTSVQYCEPQRPCTLVIGPGNHRRWEISLHAHEDPQQAATPEGTWALLSRWLTPDDGQLWRQASYRFHALVARQWRVGRAFIAGDAAHQQPPFLGQGMCQGLRDVANLAWKLNAVITGEVRGAAAHPLLDSYGVERGGHVRELTSRIKHVGALIGERDVSQARARDARLLAECGGVVRDTPRQDVLPALVGGCLSARATTARGTLFPQPWLQVDGATPQRMDAHAGHGWRLVCDDTISHAIPAIHGVKQLHIGERGAPETQGVVAAWMRRHQCHAALLRPDHYVFGVAATPAELDDLLDECGAWLRGSPHPQPETSVR
ncbi:MAG TPA: bifunctional 3-(3-hydroxy-phenyl)propionate/3-hydroxycinnamic acid hydroxylase [Burkholderiaceae bacterium]|nr:bifunctional 3-(3-hydroxy-phenyl)propionate/3-hydroxycinnamic acid hydroxylase [Burkholderiaceae bacterium]